MEMGVGGGGGVRVVVGVGGGVWSTMVTTTVSSVIMCVLVSCPNRCRLSFTSNVSFPSTSLSSRAVNVWQSLVFRVVISPDTLVSGE